MFDDYRKDSFAKIELVVEQECFAFWCPVPEIRVCFAAGQLAVFQGASDERILT